MKLNDFYYCSIDRLDGRLPQKYYNEYQYKNYEDRSAPFKILSINSNGVRVSTLWQMQVIAEAHGLNILSYDNQTNYMSCDDMQYSLNIGQKEEPCAESYCNPDRLDDYFEQLAGLAAWYGCEAMELKCLAKSLFRKYLYLSEASQLPTQEFQSLYCRLIKAGYKRCAEWLLKNHYDKINLFLQRGDSSLIIETETYFVNEVAPTNYNTVDIELQEYLTSKILPRYKNNDGGQRLDHILEVANRCVELATDVESMREEIVNIDMLLTAAYFHDFTQCSNQRSPQCYAVRILLEDDYITKFFTPEQINTIANAIQENRYPTFGGYKTKLSKMLNAACNIIDMNKLIRQAFSCSIELNPDLPIKGHLGVIYLQLESKYAKGKHKLNNDIMTESDKKQLFRLELQLRDEAQFKNYCEKLLTSKYLI